MRYSIHFDDPIESRESEPHQAQACEAGRGESEQWCAIATVPTAILT